MKKEEILMTMDMAIREDRKRFFKIADTLVLQPKFQKYIEKIECIKKQWRDITDIPDYPNITHPLPLPEWFPKVCFASAFEKDNYIREQLNIHEIFHVCNDT